MLSPVNGHVNTALRHGRSCVWIIAFSETRNNSFLRFILYGGYTSRVALPCCPDRG